MTDAFDEWVPARVALSEMAKVIHEAEGLSGDDLNYRVHTILYDRLVSGNIKCRANFFSFSGWVSSESCPIFDDPDYKTDDINASASLFWVWPLTTFDDVPIILKAFVRPRRVDWLVGDFEFEVVLHNFRYARICAKALSVCFLRSTLPLIEAPNLPPLWKPYSSAALPVAQRLVTKATTCDQMQRGNNPELSEAALMIWWNSLTADQRNLSQVTLLEMCRQAHPRNSIARQRIRQLDPGRKRGPKGFGQKVIA